MTDDPTGLVGAVKDAFRERVKAWQAWQSLQEFKALFTEILRDKGGGGSAHNKNFELKHHYEIKDRLINK